MTESRQQAALILRQAGWTQAAIGELLGVTQGTVARWTNPELRAKANAAARRRQRSRYQSDAAYREKRKAYSRHHCGYRQTPMRDDAEHLARVEAHRVRIQLANS